VSFIEAVLARGDRRLGAVLDEVCKLGGRLDAWAEYFDIGRWTAAFAAHGIDPEFYACREREYSELLPWSAISSGVSDKYLIAENEAARRGETTPDCRAKCSACGAAELCPEGVCRELS
jgi:hypothetical protein